MKKFFSNWRGSLLSFLIFLFFLFLGVRFVILNDFYDPFMFTEFEHLFVLFGFLMGLLGFSQLFFIGSLIGDIIYFVRSKLDKGNHSSKKEVDN